MPSTVAQRTRLEATRRLLHDAQGDLVTTPQETYRSFRLGVERWLDGEKSDVDVPACWAATLLGASIGRNIRGILYDRRSSGAARAAFILSQYQAEPAGAIEIMVAYDRLVTLSDSYGGIASLLQIIGRQNAGSRHGGSLLKFGLLELAKLVERYEGDAYTLKALSGWCENMSVSLCSEQEVRAALVRIERTITAVRSPVVAGRD